MTRLQLDISGRAATNIASAEMHGLSVATQVRVYQLRDGKRLSSASYAQLLEDDQALLGTDLLSGHTLVVLPEGGWRWTFRWKAKPEPLQWLRCFGRSTLIKPGGWSSPAPIFYLIERV